MANPAIWTATPDEVRTRFLEYFKGRGHEIRPSAPLVPENDPTLLFIGAGMAPFKDHFLGRVPLTFRRAASSQKCLRTGDLESVGRTPGHHTFFEMLGNFSFGDYFKQESIAWAWDFLTNEMGIPKDRLRVTVYEEDDEAVRKWERFAGIPDKTIGRLGAKSNFWPANAPEDGPDGPCGPCSEIFFDLGFKPREDDACTVEGCPDAPNSPDCGCRRFLEIWNLVFQQYDRKGPNDLAPLPSQNIDTGMGFERLLTVLAHLANPEKRIFSNFDTPLFAPLLALPLEPGRFEGSDPLDLEDPYVRVRLRRVADHARAAVFCIADGVRPSNEGRGYVLRRVIRRAVRDLIQVGFAKPFLHEYVAPVSSVMGAAYPDVPAHAAEISTVIEEEERRFRDTYEQGESLLAEAVKGAIAQGAKVLGGDVLFRLYDTYGYPPDLAADSLRSKDLEPDFAGFQKLMDERRQQSRDGSKIQAEIFAAGPLDRVKQAGPGTTFLGYGPTPEGPDGSYQWDPGVEATSTVAEILVGEAPTDRIEPGAEAAIVLAATPFYAEAGGQVGDTGEIRGPDGAVFRVTDTQKVEGFHLHRGTLEGGPLARGDAVTAVVDRARRDSVRRNHTATHLLHRVLKVLLGEEARQAGSLVAPDYLRFDFQFPRALTPEERDQVEAEVNRRVFENHPMETRVHDLESARATGAVSMFGEKYGDRVRVLTAGDSREFCGGTHCRATGDIGSFRILSEKSIGSGVRRIEAVTGERAVREFQEERRRLAAAVEEAERWKKEAGKAAKRAEGASAPPTVNLDPLVAVRGTAGRVRFAFVETANAPDSVLLGAGDRVKADGGEPLAALIASKDEGGVALVAAGNPAAVQAGFRAGDAVGTAAKVLGGGGGGRPDLARGKGSDPARLGEAVAAFEAYLAALPPPA
jgi:alanyl-tRNA synthetase